MPSRCQHVNDELVPARWQLRFVPTTAKTCAMVSTPAWPPQSTPRLFVDAVLCDSASIRIEGGQAHYLANVMRMKAGDPVKLFDNSTGEWVALIESVAKRDLVLRVDAQLRARKAVPDFWLVAAPLKKAPMDWMVEKACELGVARIAFAQTRRTIADRVNLDRLRSISIEAAEQCNRTALPEFAGPEKLQALLKNWPPSRALIFADETGGEPLAQALRKAPAPAALLIGPEGGFAPEEREMIRALPQAIPVSLGPRILRAETAALAGIATWMSVQGDWRQN
jgi:16S rRNA (uracil1498-N3)-methyltransferase